MVLPWWLKWIIQKYRAHLEREFAEGIARSEIRCKCMEKILEKTE
jgi:hypothetical protein